MLKTEVFQNVTVIGQVVSGVSKDCGDVIFQV